MNTVRAKFVCKAINQDMVELSAVYGNGEKDNKENNQFCEATPWGELKMLVNNPKAKYFFDEGEEYYLDFQKVKR